MKLTRKNIQNNLFVPFFNWVSVEKDKKITTFYFINLSQCQFVSQLITLASEWFSTCPFNNLPKVAE